MQLTKDGQIVMSHNPILNHDITRDEKGNYVELFGNPSDNNAATRSNGYETVLTQYPDLDPAIHKLGIFGKLCKPETQLQPGDRVEIYLPLNRVIGDDDEDDE